MTSFEGRLQPPVRSAAPASPGFGELYYDTDDGVLKQWTGAAWAAVGSGDGAVDSVNGETGAVVLDAADVGAAPDPVTEDDVDADLATRGTITAVTTLATTSEVVTASNTPTDITGLVVTAPASDRPYLVKFSGNVICNTLNRQYAITICDSANNILNSGNGFGPAAYSLRLHVEYLAPASAETVYKIRLTNISGTSVGTYLPGAANTPCYIYTEAK
jgi:hypothetical protein